MKYLLFLTALLMAVAVIVFFFLRGKGSKETGLRAAKAADGLDHYMYELVFRPESDELAVTLTLQYTNRTQDTQSDIVLRTWAGAYQQYETSPASIDELFDVADAGLLMPPKSTWFEPKLRSGLFIHEI